MTYQPVPEKLNTPKTYWRTRRVEGHSDWSFDFWRELFQNSLDAGAKNINISISDEAGKGSFGRDAKLDNVVRVVFDDDGSGMNEDIIRNVFLSPGESSKKNGDAVGGFGTARIMLCFSQDRYSVETNGLIVEGDGSEYTISRNDNHKHGCRMEIDIDPSEFEYYWQNVDKEKMETKLREFVQLSNLNATVTLNGNNLDAGRTLKGRYKRDLIIADENNNIVPFAQVFTSNGGKALHKGKIIVRVNGVTMFTKSVDAKEQVVIEIDPSQSRKVLMDNRDGMKRSYQRALDDFLNELSVNNLSALQEDKGKKHIEVIGKGKKNTALLDKEIITEVPDNDNQWFAQIQQMLNINNSEFDTFVKTIKGNQDVANQCLEIVSDDMKDKMRDFIERVQNGNNTLITDDNKDAASLLAANYHALRMKNQYSDMHDVHIQIDATDDKKLVALAGRYNPNYWRRKGEENQGRGRKAAVLLATWTSFCDEALRGLASIKKTSDIKYATGWYFGKTDEIWNGDEYEKQRIRALHKKMPDDTHVLMLNPVLENGKIAYDLNDTQGFKRDENGEEKMSGLQALETLAIHEVTHIIHNRHNEAFASLFTELSSLFDRTRAHKNAKKANIAVLEAFGCGDSIIQPMDDETTLAPKVSRKRKVRPAEKLMAHSTPILTATTGLLTCEENSHIEKEALNALNDITIEKHDNTTIVQNDVRNEMEVAMKDTMKTELQEELDTDWGDITDDFNEDNNKKEVNEADEILGEEISASFFKL